MGAAKSTPKKDMHVYCSGVSSCRVEAGLEQFQLGLHNVDLGSLSPKLLTIGLDQRIAPVRKHYLKRRLHGDPRGETLQFGGLAACWAWYELKIGREPLRETGL